MSTLSIVLIMVLVGFLGYMLWAIVAAAIARIGRKKKEQLAASRGIPLEIDTATGK